MNPTGNVVRTWRKQLGLTQEAFAKLARVHPMTVSRWERCKDEPLTPEAVKTLQRLHARLYPAPVETTEVQEAA